MELLTSPKQTYLLEAGLEVLHEQTTEWLSEINFWRDEAAFLYSLVVTRTSDLVPVNSKNSFEKIEQELLNITGDELDKLENLVNDHEKILTYLVECREEEQGNYRDKHREMTITFDQFEKRFRSLKKEIFTLIERIKK
jgi:hypothetical protein